MLRSNIGRVTFEMGIDEKPRRRATKYDNASENVRLIKKSL
jgi:hypothetical protein